MNTPVEENKAQNIKMKRQAWEPYGTRLLAGRGRAGLGWLGWGALRRLGIRGKDRGRRRNEGEERRDESGRVPPKGVWRVKTHPRGG